MAVISSRAPASAFFGRSGLRRNIRVGPAGLGLFRRLRDIGTATAPYLLAAKAWRSEGWRQRARLAAPDWLPPDIDTSPRQTFYVVPAVLLRRHDYVPEVVGHWAGQLVCADPVDVATGLYSRRRWVHRSARESAAANPNSGIDPADRHPGRDRLGFAGSRRTSRLLAHSNLMPVTTAVGGVRVRRWMAPRNRGEVPGSGRIGCGGWWSRRHGRPSMGAEDTVRRSEIVALKLMSGDALQRSGLPHAYAAQARTAGRLQIARRADSRLR